MPKILFTVTNDLTYDQRMIRIAGTMAAGGYEVLLIGRELKRSKPLKNEPYRQKRIRCFFNKGVRFYTEYNLRLFFVLLFTPANIICAIDLDTILPVYFASVLKNTRRVYDAHELFTEQKEIITRPFIHRIWLAIERFAVPRFKTGYTVNTFIAGEFAKRYGSEYTVVRNLPRLLPGEPVTYKKQNRLVIYQGAVNEGRCFETLIPAMKNVHAHLLICGEGNFFTQTQDLIKQYNLASKIELRGYVDPTELHTLTKTACIGINLFERTGMNQYHSLSNRFFDYIMGGIPQVCVNYPEYAAITENYPVAFLVADTDPATIAAALNNLLEDTVLYEQMAQNCIKAKQVLNWEAEEKLLFDVYKQ